MARKLLAAFALALIGATFAGISICATPLRAETTVEPDPGPVGARSDHIACFKVHDELHFKARVRLEFLHERFGLPSSCKVVGRSRALCRPVSKEVLRLRYLDGSDMAPIDMPGDDQREARVCYRVRCRTEPFFGPLRVEDQFGRRHLRELRIKRLCTNARFVNDDTTTTTLPTTTTTLPGSDPCALVDCADGYFCRPSCADLNAAECVAFAAEGEICGGFVPRCMEQRCAPGLKCLTPVPGDDVPTDLPGICVKPDDGECMTDDDCPAGEVCEPSGPPYTELYPERLVCVPGCRNDEDCERGTTCQRVSCITEPCPPQCVGDAGECASDGDCGPGRVCEPGGPLHPDRTVCVPGCRTDVDCGPDEHCEPVVCITTPCPPACVPDPPSPCGTCTNDADCPEGTRCSVPDVCLRPCDCPTCLECKGNCIVPASSGGE
jgi:hypothetical protein